MRSLLILWFLILFCSCAKKPSEEVAEAIDIALTYLSDNKCEDAIEILEDVDNDSDDAVYLQVLSSAYACKAGYSDISFIEDDIEAIDTDYLFASLSILSLSTETEVESDDFESMGYAINLLLNVDSAQPSQVNREALFGTRKGGDVGFQLLLMSITQLGKYLHFYGDVGATGAKGGGSGTNTCFVEYTYGPANTFVDNAGGVCDTVVAGDGHPDLSFADLTVARRRMCQGLMLITNIMDILENMTLPTNSSVASLSDIASSVATLKSSVTTLDPALSTLIETTSQDECEDLVNNDVNEWNNLQYIFAIVFDGGLTVGVPP